MWRHHRNSKWQSILLKGKSLVHVYNLGTAHDTCFWCVCPSRPCFDLFACCFIGRVRRIGDSAELQAMDLKDFVVCGDIKQLVCAAAVLPFAADDWLRHRSKGTGLCFMVANHHTFVEYCASKLASSYFSILGLYFQTCQLKAQRTL